MTHDCIIGSFIYSIWEFLTPTYDAMSSINLNLLMKLISIDVRYFQACVFKIFEDPNWEVRYKQILGQCKYVLTEFVLAV